MTEHYFSQQPQSKSSPMKWNYKLRGKTYSFTSDVGVFSKKEVDFGTRLLIETFEAPQITGDILDLGCGYGPIGMVIADHSPERTVVMADVNERALALAEANTKENHIHNIEIAISDQFTNLMSRKFAAVLTNPPIRAGKKVVHGMFAGAYEHLLTGGELWVVIQKKQGAPSAIEKLEELFGNCETVTRRKGYYILRAIKD